MGNQTISQLEGYAQAERLCVAADKPGAQGGFVRILTTRNLKKNARRIKETGELFDDKAHIIYVNGRLKTIRHCDR